MSNHNSDNDNDAIQLAALQTLINCIGKGQLPTHQTLPLAQRILSSSIAQTTSTSLTGATNTNANVNAKTKVSSHISSSLIKKIQRHYSKNTNANSNEIQNVISNIQNVYQDFVIQQNRKNKFNNNSNHNNNHNNSGSNNEDGSENEVVVVNNVMKILCRLAGTGRKLQQQQQQQQQRLMSSSMNQNYNIENKSRSRTTLPHPSHYHYQEINNPQDIKNDTYNDNYNDNHNNNQTHYNNPNDNDNFHPSSAPLSSSSSSSHVNNMNPYNHQNNNQNNNQNRVRTFKHIQMALQNEEQTILRECIHALQYVNGEVIRFHPSSASASASASESLQQYDIDNEKNGVDIDIQKQTIQIRNGLLPFQIDPISKVEHKGTRLLSTSTGSKDALHVCCEAGWLYSRIMNYVQFIQSRNRNRNRNGNGYNNSRSSRSNVHMNMNIGVVPRALASALMKELQSYHLLLSSLETQLLRTYQQQQQQQRQPQSNSSNETMRNRELTCRQLMIQLRAPITQLRTMAIMVDGIEPSMNGGQLLTALYLHSIHGDMRHVELVNRILYSTSLPWYDLLYDWCMNGVLLSQSTSSLTNEFFIQENINSSSDDLWHGQFVLHKDQIPYLPSIGGGNGGLLTERLANEVLIVGKGINFIRKCLHDTKWSLDVQKLIPQKALDKFIQEAKNTSSSSSPPSISVTNNEELFQEIKKLLGFHYDSISSRRLVRKDLSGQCGEIITQSPLETTVAAAAQQVHKHILMSLFEEHHLLQHLQGLKEILFLGQGDFICTLMDGLHTEFESKDVDGIDGIFMHNMMGILQEAFRSTNAKFLPQFVLQRVYIKLLSPNDAKCHRFWIDEDASATEELNGWDIFSLGYEVDAPLTAVVHPSAMEKYDQVFNLLFRLKRIEWMLNSTWKQSTVLNHALQYMITKYGENALGPASSIKRDKEIPRMKRLLRTFSLTRQMMIHFVSNLQNYLMFEVLESGWKSLVTKLGNAKTLDEVISSHDEYLDEIVTKSLLTETLGNGRVKKGTDALGRQLRLVLTVAYNFCKSHEKVFSDALQSIDKATEKRRGAERRSKAGKWGFDKLDPDVEGQHFFKLSDENTLQEILSISQDFDFSLRKLLSMLHEKVNGTLMQATINSPSQSPLVFLPDEEAPVHDDESLRYLTFRLDFSEFYST